MSVLSGDMIPGLMEEKQIPGLALRVYRSGKLLSGGEWGLADTGSGKPVTASTLFRIGCLTKPVVALAALTLADTGRLSPDDTVGKYFPALINDPGFETMTIAHLLSHRSGLPRGNYPGGLISPEKQLVNIARSKLSFRPGADYKYSNWGYFLLGEILRKASGEDPLAYCTRILRRLGMNATRFETGETERSCLATGYWKGWHFGYPDLDEPLHPAQWSPLDACAAGLLSTPDDFGKLLGALSSGRNEQGETIFSRRMLDSFFTATGNKNKGKYTSPGLFGERREGTEFWYFPGTNSGFSALFIHIPSLEISGVAMANRITCNNELKELLQLVISEHCPHAPAQLLRTPVRPLDMSFTNSAGNTLRLQTISENEAVLSGEGERIRLLPHTPQNYFQRTGNRRMHMIRLHSKKGEVTSLSRGSELYRVRGRKLREKNDPSLDKFTGMYAFPFFGKAEVLQRNGKLYLSFGVVYETLLSAAGEGLFLQEKGPFKGEEILFSDPGYTQRSDGFLLREMEFVRIV